MIKIYASIRFLFIDLYVFKLFLIFDHELRLYFSQSRLCEMLRNVPLKNRLNPLCRNFGYYEFRS